LVQEPSENPYSALLDDEEINIQEDTDEDEDEDEAEEMEDDDEYSVYNSEDAAADAHGTTDESSGNDEISSDEDEDDISEIINVRSQQAARASRNQERVGSKRAKRSTRSRPIKKRRCNKEHITTRIIKDVITCVFSNEPGIEVGGALKQVIATIEKDFGRKLVRRGN
jgi:hypothetical protein